MTYTVNGFNQRRLVDLGLDTVDAQILRWFVDFATTNRMRPAQREDGEAFLWVNYHACLEDLPILGITTTNNLSRRFKKLVDCGILDHHHHKAGGSFSTYRLGEKYLGLLAPPTPQKADGQSEKDDPYAPKGGPPTPQKAEQKTLLPENSSTKSKNSIPIFPDDQKTKGKPTPDQVLALLNELTGSKFREHKGTGLTKLIGMGYSLDDFRAVFTEKTRQWKGGDFEKYLRPATLFQVAKFEGYLSEARKPQGAQPGKFRASNVDSSKPAFEVLKL